MPLATSPPRRLMTTTRKPAPPDADPLLNWREIELTFPPLAGHGHRLSSWASAGRFPQPVKFNGRVYRYKLSDVTKWVAERSV